MSHGLAAVSCVVSGLFASPCTLNDAFSKLLSVSCQLDPLLYAIHCNVRLLTVSFPGALALSLVVFLSFKVFISSCHNSVTLSVKHKGNSLIAPVEPYGDVPLDLTSLVLCKMTLDQLPTQVDELVHHMTQLVEQIHLVFLLKQPKKDLLRIVNSYCSIYVKTITKTLQSIYLIFSVLLIV